MNGNYYNPFEMSQKKDSDLMKWQLATIDLIEEIKHELACEIYNTETDTWVRSTGVTPLVNEMGINSLIGFVSGLANKNTILSNLSEKDVNVIMQNLCDRLAEHLFLNWEDYKIEKMNIDMVFFKIENFCLMSLKRAQDEGERSFLKQTESRREIINVGDGGKRSILPGWLGKGKGE